MLTPICENGKRKVELLDQTECRRGVAMITVVSVNDGTVFYLHSNPKLEGKLMVSTTSNDSKHRPRSGQQD